jgi:hypothetical protein
MKKYARIENNRVVEIIETDTIEGKFHPALIFVEIPLELNEVVKVGWDYIDGNFTDDTIKREQQEQEEQELLENLKPTEKEVLMAEIEINTINLLIESEVI